MNKLEKLAASHGAKFREATERTSIMVTAADLRGAKERDCERCAIARAIKRTTGQDFAVVLPSKAYALELNEDGERELVRYEMPRKTRLKVRRFDEEGEFPEGRIVLRPVAKSVRLENNRETVRRYKARKAAGAATPTTKPEDRRLPTRTYILP